MTHTNSSSRTRRTIGSVVALIILVMLSISIYRQPDLPPQPAPSTPAPISGAHTLEGKPTCLPHKNTSGPQTMECAIGIEVKDAATGSSVYYALDLAQLGMQISATIQSLPHVKLQGTVVPTEALSADHWQKYNMKGIMRVEKVL